MSRGIHLILVICFAFPLFGDERVSYIDLINSGKLTEAKRELTLVVSDDSSKPLDKAIAYKHLGTTLFRLGESFNDAFASSEKIFKDILRKSSDGNVQREYSLMLYQRANCLISACESDLSKSKLQGIPVVPFQLVKTYISPAQQALNDAKEHYPIAQMDEISLLYLELNLCEYHIWSIAGQNAMAAHAAQKALKTVEESKLNPMKPDARLKFAIRHATLLAETSDKNVESINQAIIVLEKELDNTSGNVELDVAAITLWAKLKLSIVPETPISELLEKRLLNAADSLEGLRAYNVGNMDFIARKEYYTTRTGVYETLVELYGRQNQPFKLLQAIDRMRSRSIQDFVLATKEESLNEAELRDILKKNNGIIVAYFLTVKTVWMVAFDSNGGTISHTKHSGQEIASLASGVLNIFSNVQHPQAYYRFGPSYRPVAEAYHAANLLYKELLEEIHQKFLKGKYDHFYVIPHHILNYLPFSALVVNVNDNNAFQSQFVADIGLPLTCLPSLTTIRPSDSKYDMKNTMVMARGTYSYPAFYNACPENPDNLAAPPLNLPNVPNEGRQIAQMLQTPPEYCFAERDASEYNLIKQTTETSKSIVHIASHAHLNCNSPLDSYVVLAASDNEDGKVKVRELLDKYRGKLKIGLLVLSACDTNKGEASIQPGDDIAALSNAFIVAGAENVIATQWPASDTSFPQIMRIFYEHIRQGASPDIALALAQRQFLSSCQMAMRYPIFWANIVLCGKKQKK